MNVVHVLRKYDPAEWGGTETALLQLCAGLNRHNVRSVIYAPRCSSVPATDPLSEAGCAIRRFRARLPVWGLSPPQRRQLVAVGGNLISFELIRSLRAEPSVGVIHTHALGRLGGVAWKAARRRGCPVLATIHGGFLDLPAAVWKNFQAQARIGFDWGKLFGAWVQSRRLLENVDAVLTCNGREAELLRTKYPNQRIVVHSHGIAADRFRKDHREDAAQAFPFLRGRFALLTVGRIDPSKNQVWLVEQMPEILRRVPNATLVLAGACTHESYGAELNRRIEALQLDGRIVLVGGLPPADPRLIGLYQLAAAVIVPSHAETFGLVILEAWAAGAPVISSRTSGACSLVRHGENGWLFDLDQPETFHFALEQTLNRPELARQLATAGCRQVCAEFDTGVQAGRMKKLYEDLIEARHALRHTSRR